MSSGDPDTRRRIVHATLRLLEERGGAPISMADIAAAAGVSRQALYLHFDDRTALLLEASRFADAANRTPRRQARVDGAPSARQALREAVALQGYLKPRLHAMTVALGVLRRSDDAAEAAWQERDRARLARCRELANRLHREGDLAEGVSVDDAAALIWVTTAAGVWEDLTQNLGWSTRRYTDHLARYLEAALLNET